MQTPRLLLALYGPTGSGKTTLARHLVEAHGAALVKIADPLYAIHDYYYQAIGRQVVDKDGELLQFLGSKVERDWPGWLAEHFLQQVQRVQGLVVNDDSRISSYAPMRSEGFVFVRISASAETRRLRRQETFRPVDESHPLELGFDGYEPDGNIDNDGPLEIACAQLDALLAALLAGERSAHKMPLES
jgi:hypothetical protein